VWLRKIHEKVLDWAPGHVSLMILSYRVLPFLWYGMIAQLDGKTID
jgi:hypothetical protein